MPKRKSGQTALKCLMQQAELAERTGIGQPVVHRIASGETHNPKLGTLRPLARYFGISIDTLIGEAPMALPEPIQSRALLQNLLADLQHMARDLDGAIQVISKFLEATGKSTTTS